MRTYVTLLSTDDYLKGVLALFRSLQAQKSKYDLLVMVSGNISGASKKTLRNFNLKYSEIKDINNMRKMNPLKPYWGNVYDKLNMFSLTDYEKMVYLDADMMVLDNIDELFDEPSISGVISGKKRFNEWKAINGGLVVFEPCHDAFESMIDILMTTDDTRKNDQDIISEVYPDFKQLDEKYNMFYQWIPVYQKHGWLSDDLKVIHFISPQKPWMEDYYYGDIMGLETKYKEYMLMNE